MKFTSKSAAIVAALAMATTGALALGNSEKTADAATVATVHSGVTARLYTQTGKLVSNRALAPNTAWQVGKISNINGETMYQVSTNEYLKASDSSIMGADANSSKKIGKAAFRELSLYRDDTNSMANRSLAKNSSWQIGKFIRNKNNQEFVQVSTHEYADAALLAYNHPMTNPTYIADFGTNTDFTVIKVGNGDLGTGTPVTPSNPSTTPSTDQNQGGSTTTTTPSQPSTGTGTNSNHDDGTSTTTNNVASIPDASQFENAVAQSINQERASQGLPALSIDPTLSAIAKVRAQEASVNFSHTRPDGNTWYTELHQKTSYEGGGENLFGTPWSQLSVQTPEHYAKVVMDNYRGEGISTSSNHYMTVINPRNTMMGIGVHVTSTGSVYVAEDFAR